MLRSGEFIRGCAVVEKRAWELVTGIRYTVRELDSGCFESIVWADVLTLRSEVSLQHLSYLSVSFESVP